MQLSYVLFSLVDLFLTQCVICSGVYLHDIFSIKDKVQGESQPQIEPSRQ